jgi:hypothetical protein
MQFSLRHAGFALALGVSAFLLPSASADTILNFTLNVDGCTSGCGSNGNGSTNNDFGVVQLDDNGSGTVIVTETLNAAQFVNSSGKEALAFNLSALAGLKITLSDPADYSIATGGSFPMAPFGSGASDFTEAIHCDACGSGASHPQPGPLVFTVTATNGVTAADFTAIGSGYFFASDVKGARSGNTGDVAANGPGVPVTSAPEPATPLLTLAGAALFGLSQLRRKLK